MASNINLNRSHLFSRRRRQQMQSAAILSLAGLLLLGEIARLHSSLPQPENDAGNNTAVSEANAPAETTKVAVPALSVEELARLHVNEAGRIPIVEYHDIKVGRNRLFRSPTAFRHDLARLYAENYRPIALRDYVDNRIDVPAGMTPVVLTFDDARESQFRYLPDGGIDPDCAIGILQEFARSHPDFPIKATFFALTEWGFGPKKFTQQKFQALQAMGCDLQNHTFNHNYFGRMSDEAIIKEIADGKASIERLAPRARVDMLALPGGQHPRSKHNALLVDGEYHSIRYHNRAVFDAWGGAAPSPAAAAFDPVRIPRTEPNENEDDGLTRQLNDLKAHPGRRYISDGNAAVVTIPRARAAAISKANLQGAQLRVY